MTLGIPNRNTFDQRLSYPWGRNPGVDLSCIGQCKNYFSAGVINGMPINFSNGRRPDTSLIPSNTFIDGYIGQTVTTSSSGGTSCIFTNQWATGAGSSVSQYTMAAIFTANDFGGSLGQGVFIASHATPNSGVGLGMQVSFDTFGIGIYGNGVFKGYTNVPITTGKRYFVGVSFLNASPAVMVARDLQNGNLAAGLSTGVPNVAVAGDGNFYVGGQSSQLPVSQGNFNHVMISNGYTPMGMLQEWAQDPWKFWYPDNMGYGFVGTAAAPTTITQHSLLLMGAGQ